MLLIMSVVPSWGLTTEGSTSFDVLLQFYIISTAQQAMSYPSSHVEILQQQLELNPNTRGLKLVILDRMHDIENLAYWKTTSDQSELLQNFWSHSIHSDGILKGKIEAVVQGRNTEVQLQIVSGVKEMGRTAHHRQEDPGAEDVGNSQVPSPKEHIHRKNKSMQLDSSMTMPSPLIEQLVLQNYPMHNHEYFSANSQQTKEAEQYIKSLKQEYQRFKRQLQTRKDRIAQKRSQKQSEQFNHEQLLREEQRKKKEQELQQHLDHLKQEHERRELEIRNFRKFYKQYKQAKPLHVMIEEQFKQKIQLPMLEEQQHKIKNRPHVKKPSLDEINEHDSRYMEKKRDHQQNSSVTISHEPVSVAFRGKFYRKAARSYMGTLQADTEEQDAYERSQKIQRYAQYVKDQLKPKIDEYKRRQLQERIRASSLAYPLSAVKNAEKEQDIAAKAQQISDRKYTLEVGNRYMQFVHRKAKKRQGSSVDNSGSDEQSQKPDASQKTLPKKINYLEQQKLLHQHKRTNLQSWQRDLHDPSLTDYDKRQRVLLKSRLLQQSALRYEQKLQNDDTQSHGERIQVKRRADDALLEAIKAKMAVLKN